MMTFREHNKPSKVLVLHYAKQLGCDLAIKIASGEEENIGSIVEAEELADFFWEMTSQAVDDEANCKEIEGIIDFQFWLEKALNIFTGYFKKQGYEKVWSGGCGKYHDE